MTTKEGRILDLICQIQQDGEFRNLSRTTKDALAAAFAFVVKNCDLDAMSKVKAVLSAPSAAGLSLGDGDSEDDLFPSETQPGDGQPADFLSVDKAMGGLDSDSNNDFTLVKSKRPRLCKSRWKGQECENADCPFAHPPYCTDLACKDKRLPNCEAWHTRPKAARPKLRPAKSGNGNRGAPSSFNPKGFSKSGKKTEDVRDLKLRLANTQLALFRAQKKSVTIRPNNSYASVVASRSPPATTAHPPTQIVSDASQARAVTTQEGDLCAQMALIVEQLASLAARLRA